MKEIHPVINGNRVEYKLVGTKKGTVHSLYDATRQLWLADFETEKEREAFVEKHHLVEI